jgi:hypothetical protein
MELLNENLNHYLAEDGMGGGNPLYENATPMWMSYMEAFNSFVEQGGKRLERYETYEEMDRYPEIHLALDIISTEIFVFDALANTPFLVDTDGKVPEGIISKAISQFTDKLKLKETLPFAVRQSLKYGDSFYFVVRDQSGKMAGLRRIDNKDIDFIEYDEVGVEPLNYYIAKKKIDEANMGSYLAFLKHQNLTAASQQKMASIAAKEGDEFYVIPRKSMVRFMNRGQNSKFFPFGESYLESIFPYWKKVSLLEDSLIIYRIVRAPERRVFYIDVGKAPAKIAEKVVSQTKDEIKRRRTAASQENKEMGIASSFNPLSMQEDYFFAQRADGRGSRVETLPGASNLGEIADVNYFYKKLIAGMRVPSSYFNAENPPTWNDGKVGSALAEEARFGKWLTEIREQFLGDFKVLFLDFLKERGINISDEQLDLKWKESINVAENQELEKMIQRQSVFTGFPMEQFAPTFLQKKVLGWSEEEIQENMTQLVKWQKYKDNNNLM